MSPMEYGPPPDGVEHVGPNGFDYGPNGPKRDVTCHTHSCPNYGIAITVPDDGSIVVCGPCDQRIE